MQSGIFTGHKGYPLIAVTKVVARTSQDKGHTAPCANIGISIFLFLLPESRNIGFRER